VTRFDILHKSLSQTT